MPTRYLSRICWRVRLTGVVQALVMAVCVFAAALLLGAVVPVRAAYADGGAAQFSIRPTAPGSDAAGSAPYFVLNLKPGATIKSNVRITNTGTTSGSVALYPVDATTGQTSGVVYRSQTDPRTDVGGWITVGASHVALDPGKSQVVSFTVTAPRSARPGQYVGGLVAENLAVQGSASGSVQINIQHLSIVAVQVNLPGQQVQQLAATGIRAGGQQGYQILYLNLHNIGTQMLKPIGTLKITDTRGRQLKQMNLALDTVLPQTAIAYPVYVDGQALGPGHYRAVLSLTYGDPRRTLNQIFNFEITAAAVQQVFGTRPPNSAPLLANGLSGAPILLLVGGGVVALLLGGFGVSLILAPGLRARLRYRRR